MNQFARQRRILAGAAVVGVAALVSGAMASGASAVTRHTKAPSQQASTLGQQRGPRVPTLTWSDCGNGLQCSTAEVPLDYDHPRGRTIELQLTRLPAGKPSERIGTLFVNTGILMGVPHGGKFVRDRAKSVLPDRVRRRFDVVGVDTRGRRGDSALRCFDSVEAQQRYMADVQLIPVTWRDFLDEVVGSVKLAVKCAKNNPKLLPHMSTANVARDLNLLRKAVGDDKLSFAGFGYGTYVGATYASMFPGKVRVLLLGGMTDPGKISGREAPRRSSLWVRQNNARAGSETLQKFFAMCEAAEQQCAFAANGAAEDKFAELAQRVKEDPMRIPRP